MQDRVRGGTQESSAAASSAPIRAAVPNPRAAVDTSARRLLLCFFLSGAAALIFQLAWTKLLALLFGHSAYALGTVLGVFMSGLTLSNGAMKSEQLLLLGRMALQSGHVNNALELLDEANRGTDNHSRAVYWLVVAEHNNGSVTQAQTRLDDYLKLNPFDLEAQHLRVELAREAADWTTGIALQRRIVAGSSSAADYCVLGDLYLRAAKLQETTQPLQKGLEIEPYSFLCHRDLGELQRVTGDMDGAVDNLRFVIRYFPEADPKTYISLALIYKQGQKRKAREVLAKGRRIFPKDPLLMQFRVPG